MLVSIESIPRPILKASSFMWLWLALKSTYLCFFLSVLTLKQLGLWRAHGTFKGYISY